MKLDPRRHLALLALVPTILLLGCVTPATQHDPRLTAALDEILDRHADTGATFTARVVELESGRELYARNIDTPYTPASNMKLPVSATGLDTFGPQHTFKTYLLLIGDDLWLIGTGDPAVGDPRLAKRHGRTTTSVLDDWADALLARGVQHVPGQLYYHDTALDNEWLHDSWGEDVLHWYGAPVTGLNFNDNCVDITIFPTVAGQPVRYEVMPPVQHITVINECLTGPNHEPTIAKLPDGDIYKLAGTCNEQAELKSKPVTNPGAFFCDALRTHFAARGITITGDTHHATSPPGGLLPPLPHHIVATHETTLRDILHRINTNSQNLFAEALCKLAGQAYMARKARDLPGSWINGEQAIRVFLRRNSIDDRHFVLADASGLSEDNKVTARLITDLLAVMFAHPHADVFIDSLAKGGTSGTLKKRFPNLEDRVYAKTGYIGGVRALSGYLRTESNTWLAFSIIYNQIPGTVKPYEKLQDEALRLLAQ